MGVYDTLPQLLDLVKTIVGWKTDLTKAALERRLLMADRLQKIEVNLERIADEFRNGGNRPNEFCGELSVDLNSLIEIVGKEVGDEKVACYKKVFNASVLARGMLYAPFDAGSKENLLLTLEDVSGRVKALANTLRV